MPRTFSRTSSRTALLLTTGLLSGMVGCSTEAPPALTVGDVSYSEAELLGLTLAGHPNPKRLLTTDGIPPLLRKSQLIRSEEEVKRR